MKILRASTHIGNGILRVRMNDTMIIENTGTCEIEIGDSEKNILQWFASGIPGTVYSITISAPKEAEFHLTRVLGKCGKAYGDMSF